MNKKIKFGAFLVVLSLTLSPLKAFATDLEDQINSNNQQKNELEKRKEEVNNLGDSANKDLQGILEQVESKNIELTASNEKVQAFQTEIDALQGQIDGLQGSTDKAQNDIDSKQELIEKKEQESIERQTMLGNRLRSYYKNDMNSQALYVVLESESITDLISNMINVSKLLNLDEDLINEIKDIQAILDEEKLLSQKEMDKLNKEKEQIKSKQQEQVDAQKGFIDEKNKYEAEMQELATLEKSKEDAVNSLSQQEKEIQDKIGDINSYNQDLQDQINKVFENINNNSNNGNTNQDIANGEGFLTPAGGSISSPYGARVHPITGVSGFHTGVDFAASNNSAILASKSGTVAFAGVQSGYGNVVILDHGNGIQTLYAHCSSILISNGQTVSRGETIAKVGSTGNSTGPHLHFEVRVNGKHTNPMNYL
ncbi:murein hydrolase activator EnvC family protein [Clostridium vincentii]|uniref:Murein DD-endopeptidase MepM n=1 Tax=Clostridium vincentii TaxID=52704 RepID=A0A2T0BEJ1_9CLOT|nr:peptidoglycan DD-metalloendopeptidase family protein [Clostridium vincentii]PRR82316.1 Murein DD-endopeptidase MepM [Clostridium vincentii]